MNGVTNIAKPLILVSMFDLIVDGLVDRNRFDIEIIANRYSELQEVYATKTPCQYPLYFLEHEEFYHLKWKGEKVITHTPSRKLMREKVEYAYLDNALWDLLQDKETMDYFRTQIVNGYLK